MRTTARLLAATATFALLASLAACGDDSIDDGAAGAGSTNATAPPTTVPAPFVAMRWVDSGGCEVMGPNCPTYTVWSDGKVEISRTGDDAPAEVTGTVPASEVQAWLTSVADLDEALNFRGVPSFAADALHGPGVFETLRGISEQVLRRLSTGSQGR